MSSRRRLQVLPEMLPKPERRSALTSTVRSRTLARLKVLAAVSAAGVAASCSGKTVNSSGSSSGTSGDPFLDSGRDGPDTDGYCVVDPLPNPSCFQYQTPSATASYVTEDELDGGTEGGDGGIVDAGNGARLVEVLLGFKQSGVVIGSLTSSDGVTLAEGTTTSSGARIVLRVPAGLTNAQARLQVSCPPGPSALNIDLNLAASTVTVTVSEY